MANHQKDPDITVGKIVSEELMKLSLGYLTTAASNLTDSNGGPENAFNRTFRDLMIAKALQNQGVRSALALTIENRVLNEVIGTK